jgi:alkaline phosphatase
MNRQLAVLLIAIAVSVVPAYSQAKNVILFIGDGAGVSSLNAASIYGYGKPQALYIQKMPHLALADTSTAKEWVTDGAACASAWATGHKGRNGVVSMSADAERDVKDGEIYKTVMEYAMENGLSTGVISNEDRTGVTDAVVSAFYAHHNNRGRSSDIFQQALSPKFGKGPDVMIGTGRKVIAAASSKAGHDLAAEIKSKGYVYLDSLAAVSQQSKNQDRVIALIDDEQFDFNEAVQQAVARLSKNPKGFLLVAHSDCHTGKTRTSLQRVIDLDKAVAATGEQLKSNTLILFTADHSYDLRIKGESLVETSRASDHTKIVSIVSLEDEHTAEEVPLLGMGPGSERIGGFMSNADVFHIIMSGFRWEQWDSPSSQRQASASR